MKILLVDDSYMIRKILERKLRSFFEDCEYLHASSAIEALDLLHNYMPIEYLIINTDMPEMDGYTCLTKIRSYEKYSSVNVFLRTPEENREMLLENIIEGARKFLKGL